MARINFFLALFLLTSIKLVAQDTCNLSILSSEEKRQLNSFYLEFKEAINSQNKAMLCKLYNFPFNCTLCSPNSEKPFESITREMFLQFGYKFFMTENFVNFVNKNDIKQILHADKQDDGSCGYSFGVPIRLATQNNGGLHCFVTLKKIKDVYKIASVWSVP